MCFSHTSFCVEIVPCLLVGIVNVTDLLFDICCCTETCPRLGTVWESPLPPRPYRDRLLRPTVFRHRQRQCKSYIILVAHSWHACQIQRQIAACWSWYICPLYRCSHGMAEHSWARFRCHISVCKAWPNILNNDWSPPTVGSRLRRSQGKFPRVTGI